MKATIKVDVLPFPVPDCVYANNGTDGLRQEGFNEPVQYRLSEVDPESLKILCDQFVEEVFKKAGRGSPPITIALRSHPR